MRGRPPYAGFTPNAPDGVGRRKHYPLPGSGSNGVQFPRLNLKRDGMEITMGLRQSPPNPLTPDRVTDVVPPTLERGPVSRLKNQGLQRMPTGSRRLLPAAGLSGQESRTQAPPTKKAVVVLLSDLTENAYLAEVVGELLREIKGGKALSEALSTYPQVFPKV